MRFGKPIKNKRRRDPRYFLSEDIQISNQSNRNMHDVQFHLEEFYPFCKEALGFDQDATVVFESDFKNAKNPLGKTAHYDPASSTVTVYVDKRHSKDIMRSVSHELVHHAQNVRGDLQGSSMEEGYAQKDEHLREMEKEAYTMGNMIFRDWEDSRKASNTDDTIMARLMQEWGYDETALQEQGSGFEEGQLVKVVSSALAIDGEKLGTVVSYEDPAVLIKLDDDQEGKYVPDDKMVKVKKDYVEPRADSGFAPEMGAAEDETLGEDMDDDDFGDDEFDMDALEQEFPWLAKDVKTGKVPASVAAELADEFGDKEVPEEEEPVVMKEAEFVGHHAEIDGEIYVDSDFLNSVKKIRDTFPHELKSMGFGEFYLETPKGKVQFDRTRGQSVQGTVPGFVGRAHQLYGEPPELADELMAAMEAAGASEAASIEGVAGSDSEGYSKVAGSRPMQEAPIELEEDDFDLFGPEPGDPDYVEPIDEETVTLVHKISGKEIVVVASAVEDKVATGEWEERDKIKVTEKMSPEEEKEMTDKMSNREFYKYITHDKHVRPSIDREQYTEIPGMEGPFQYDSGAVLYYDPKTGDYYDRGKDMYLDRDEAAELTMETLTLDVATADAAFLAAVNEDDFDLFAPEPGDPDYVAPTDEKVVTLVHKTSGKEIVVVAGAAEDKIATGEWEELEQTLHEVTTAAPEWVSQLLDMEAENEGVEAGIVEVTPEVEEEYQKYNNALEHALEKLVGPEMMHKMMDDEAAYLVMMTLRGEGVGIWDGSWEHYEKEGANLKDLDKKLKQYLNHYVDDTGGGVFNDALRNAVDEAGAYSEYQAERSQPSMQELEQTRGTAQPPLKEKQQETQNMNLEEMVRAAVRKALKEKKYRREDEKEKEEVKETINIAEKHGGGDPWDCPEGQQMSDETGECVGGEKEGELYEAGDKKKGDKDEPQGELSAAQKKLDLDDDGKIEPSDLKGLRAGKKDKDVGKEKEEEEKEKKNEAPDKEWYDSELFENLKRKWAK